MNQNVNNYVSHSPRSENTCYRQKQTEKVSGYGDENAQNGVAQQFKVEQDTNRKKIRKKPRFHNEGPAEVQKHAQANGRRLLNTNK